MASYTETFTGQTTGSASSTFTSRYASVSAATIENPSIGEQDSRVLQMASTDSGFQMWSMDAVDSDGTRADSEVLARFWVTADNYAEWNICMRASGSSGSETCYYFGINSAHSLSIYRYNSGSASALRYEDANTGPCGWSSFIDNAHLDTPDGYWLWVRARVNGTGATVTASVKVWGEGQEEPPDWGFSVADTNASRITSAGWTGIGKGQYSGTTYWDMVSVATNGDTASIPAGTSTVRITTAAAEALVTDNSTPVRMTTIAAEALVTDNSTPVRMTTTSVEVLMDIEPPTGGGGGPSVVVCSIVM